MATNHTTILNAVQVFLNVISQRCHNDGISAFALLRKLVLFREQLYGHSKRISAVGVAVTAVMFRIKSKSAKIVAARRMC